MTAYKWPRNIRELKNLMEMLVSMCAGPIISLSHLERCIIDKALEKAGGVKTDTVNLFCISIYSLLRILKALNPITGNKQDICLKH